MIPKKKIGHNHKGSTLEPLGIHGSPTSESDVLLYYEFSDGPLLWAPWILVGSVL